MQDWLSETIEIFEEYESPKRYYYWSCLAAVSAIVKDRVYFDKFLYQTFPSVYILLYGPSAIKKGPPINLAKQIVSRLDCTRVINGRATVEAIIKELGSVRSRPGKQPLNDSAAFLVASEWSSSLVANTNSLEILTDLFDRIYNTDGWEYNLKNAALIKLKRPTITWLAGTNEALFRDFVPEKNLKGGLIGRTFVISETHENKLNSLMNRPKIVPDYAKISQGVKHLEFLSGEMKMSLDVRAAFDTWYMEFRTKVAPKLEDDTGMVGRIDEHIIKLAMLISCARRADLQITIDDLEEAMKEVLQLIAPTKKVTRNAKQNEITSIEKRAVIIKHLANCEGFKDTRTNILMRHTLKMDHEDLDRIVTFLEQSKVILCNRNGRETEYELNTKREIVMEYVKEYQK